MVPYLIFFVSTWRRGGMIAMLSAESHAFTQMSVYLYIPDYVSNSPVNYVASALSFLWCCAYGIKILFKHSNFKRQHSIFIYNPTMPIRRAYYNTGKNPEDEMSNAVTTLGGNVFKVL